MMQSRPKFKPGEIILLAFPFTDFQKAKQRPALVLIDTEDNDIIVCRITSRISKTPFDILIKKWKESGLLLPSIARIHKIATIERNLVKCKLGKLEKDDWEKIKSVIKKLLRLINVN